MQRSQTRRATAERFSVEARCFIGWADGSASPEPLTAAVGLRRVVALYAAALQLPQPWSERVSHQRDDAPALAQGLAAVRGRAAAIPLQHYSEIFSPLVPQDEPVVGDLADDLVEIYRDIAAGLHWLDAGRVDDALWEWGFNFQVHWGEHASSAIRALHCYLAQEDPSGLCSDG
jgi:hypothetical protein